MGIITYQLQCHDGRMARFDIDVERKESLTAPSGATPPAWTRLDTHQCPNCPLEVSRRRYCPAAIEIEEIASQFTEASSIERTDVWVHTEGRSFFKNVDMQTALRSLFGLILASGPCPILNRLKPLAHLHLPFATLQETFQRLIGSYLITQYLNHKDGQDADWDLKGIEQLYSELKVVNLHLMKRIRLASKEDASINAIQTFVSITSLVAMGMDDIIPALREGLYNKHK